MAKRESVPMPATFTILPPDQAAALLVQTLTASGAQVSSQTPTSITGIMHIRRRPSCIVALLLFALLIIPGVVYLVISSKDVDDPYSIQLIPEGQGSMVHAAGQGYGLEVALEAMKRLPS
jgi:hypothetical protein